MLSKSDAESFLRDLEGVSDDESDVAGVDAVGDEDEDGRRERHQVPDRLQAHSQPPEKHNTSWPPSLWTSFIDGPPT